MIPILVGFCLMFVNGNQVEYLISYLFFFIISLYIRMRLNYFNPIQLEIRAGNDHYCIPDWEVLINQINWSLKSQLIQFQQKLNGETKTQFYPVTNQINRKTRAYLFLSHRSFASSPEVHKLAVEAFKVAVKANNEGVPLAFSIATLSVAVTAILVAQYTQHTLAKEAGAREDKRIAIQQKQVDLEQQKVDIARDNYNLQVRKVVLQQQTHNQEYLELRTKQRISDALGPYINMKQRSQLEQKDLSKLADIIGNKINPSSSSSSLMD